MLVARKKIKYLYVGQRMIHIHYFLILDSLIFINLLYLIKVIYAVTYFLVQYKNNSFFLKEEYDFTKNGQKPAQKL